MNPFDYVNAITFKKEDIMTDDLDEKAYNSFIINRQLSYFRDTVALANEMNFYHQIDNKLQFSFLINTVRKRKRFAKWAKQVVESDLEVVQEFYGYSKDKARQAITLLSEEQLKELRQRMYKGGTK